MGFVSVLTIIDAITSEQLDTLGSHYPQALQGIKAINCVQINKRSNLFYTFQERLEAEITFLQWALTRNHTTIRAAFVCLFVCLFVCSLSPPWSSDRSSPNLVGVCRWTSHLPLRGSVLKRSTGRRVNGSLLLFTILYRDQPHTTQLQKAPFALVPQLQSLIWRLLLLHINGICRWTSQLLWRGSFFKRSTGQWVNGSNGSTGHFHFYI